MLPLYSAVLSSDGLFADLIDLRGLYGAGRLRLTVDRGSVRLSAGAAPEALDVIWDYGVGVFEVSIPLTRWVKVERLTGNSSTILVEILPHTADKRNVTATLSDGGIAKKAFAVSAGAEAVPLQRAQSRIRASAPTSEGSVLVDLAALPTTTIAGANGGSGKWTLVTLDDGSIRWGVELTAIYGPSSAYTSYAEFTLPSPRVFGSDDVLDIEIYCPKPCIPRVLLGGADLTGGTFMQWNGANNVGALTYARRTGLMRLKVPFSKMTAQGGINPSAVMQKVRVMNVNTGSRGRKMAVLGQIRVGRREKTQLVMTTDDGLPESLWLADQLAARGLKLTAYIIPGLIDTAGFMTSAQLAALATKSNVQIGCHSYSHTYANGGPTGSVWSSTVEGISVSKPVAVGPLALDGTIGANTFDKPRHVTFVTTAANNGVQIDVVGELNGVAQFETVYMGPANDYPYPTALFYDKVTSLTVSTPGVATVAGNIKVGTSCSYDEMYYDWRRGFEYSENRGYSSASDRHACCPQGQSNELFFRVMKDLGVKTVRMTEVTTFSLSAPHDVYKRPACAIEEAFAANVMLYTDQAVQQGDSLDAYLHQIKTDNSAPAAGGIRASTLTPLLDQWGSYVQSGQADSPTVSEMYAKTFAIEI